MSLKPHLQIQSLIVLSMVSACLAGPLRAQAGTAVKPTVPAPTSPGPAASDPVKPEALPRPLTAKEQREARIAADTEKLYQLAQELKAELDKSNKNTLSLSVIRKAAEIEKLAHSISERMKSN